LLSRPLLRKKKNEEEEEKFMMIKLSLIKSELTTIDHQLASDKCPALLTSGTSDINKKLLYIG